MTKEVKLWVDGGYTFGKPDYGSIYRVDNNNQVYITDYSVPLRESITRMLRHHNSKEGNKRWKFNRMYHDHKHDCMIIVIEEQAETT